MILTKLHSVLSIIIIKTSSDLKNIRQCKSFKNLTKNIKDKLLKENVYIL